MKRLRAYLRKHGRLLAGLFIGLAALMWLMFHKLAFLTGGLSAGELSAAHSSVGWHGIYRQPLGLPLKAMRSIIFALFPNHGQLLTRLPNVIFGVLSIVIFAWLARIWHGTRPAVLATILFATSAWTLHVSRLASPDVEYLWVVLTLLLINVWLPKYATKKLVWYGSILSWGLILYIPGMIWLVLISVVLQRKQIVQGWKHFALLWQRLLYVLAGLIWLPLLIIDWLRPGQFGLWLGLPAHLSSPAAFIKNLLGVPVHLFIRGPQYPDIWLGRLPILDAFTLVAVVAGTYYYATHAQIARGRLLGLFFIIGTIMVGLDGPVGLSLIVPLLYMLAATGIAYLLHQWLKVFPLNPFARGLGVGIVVLAVSLSSTYNLRQYFVAWPHNTITRSTFQYHT